MIDLNDITSINHCLVVDNAQSNELSWLWHKRLGHASFNLINKLIKKDLVIGIPHIWFDEDKICNACQLEKQTRESFKLKNIASTTRILELLHMDLFGPTRIASLRGMQYALMIVDDFSRYTWIPFIAHKDEMFKVFKKFYKRITNIKNLSVISIHSDHGMEFENQFFDHFYTKHRIEHNFFAPRTP